jgi:CheY-like chemotaxis protein
MRVLVVDDERAIADSLARILLSYGYESRAVYSGRDAMCGAAEFRPQVLITDIVMPGMNGVELAEWFTAEQPDCRVMMTSANLLHFEPADLEFPHSDRVVFLAKPVRIPDLIEFLAKGEVAR